MLQQAVWCLSEERLRSVEYAVEFAVRLRGLQVAPRHEREQGCAVLGDDEARLDPALVNALLGITPALPRSAMHLLGCLILNLHPGVCATGTSTVCTVPRYNDFSSQHSSTLENSLDGREVTAKYTSTVPNNSLRHQKVSTLGNALLPSKMLVRLLRPKSLVTS